MGNNLQALRTAKALTKQLSRDDSYVTTNGSKDLEINHEKLHGLTHSSMSLQSPVDSVTQDQTSTDKRYKAKESMTNRDVTSNQPEYVNGLNEANYKHDTNSFVYYVPQSDDPQDGLNVTHHRKSQETIISQSPNRTTAQPVVVDLTLDDSDEEEEPSTASSPQNDTSANTFPKILATYSLNAGNSPFPASDLCSLLSQKTKESLTKANGTVMDALNRTKSGLVVDSSTLNKTKPTNGLVFSNKPKNYSLDQRPSLMNGFVHSTKDNSHRISSNQPRNSYTSSMVGYKNGVMNDVTNSTNPARTSVVYFRNDVINDVIKPNDQLRNINVSGMAKNENDITNTRDSVAHEYSPLLLSPWSRATDMRPLDDENTSSDSNDNVVITKVVTRTDKVSERSSKKHPRKEPIKVRPIYFDQEVSNDEPANPVARNKKRPMAASTGDRKRTRLGDVVKNVQSGQSPVEESQEQIADRLSPNNIHREAKIRTLKNLLAKQEIAVQKMRINDTGSPSLVPSDRVLVVKIPDLKSELGLPREGKHSFRVSSQAISVSPDDQSVRKRPRKRDPRKITRQEGRYPSYVEAKALSYLHDDDDVPNKKVKGKSRGKSRGRCSPKPYKPVPVVIKDAWHQELEKAEVVVATSGRPVDQATFLLFLGLKPV